MKITHLIAAGIALATLGLGTAATAQDYNRGNDQRDHRGDHRYDHRDDRRYDHRDDRRHYGHQPRCHTEWRHHHRVRICR